MSELIELLRQHWLDQGIELGNGVSESQVEKLEAKYQIILPDDFREYLLSISWPEDYEMDDSLISFWTIKRIREEHSHAKSEAKYYLVFADFFAISHEYAIKLQPQSTATSPVFFVYGDYVQIATSFTEFLERYIADDAGMLFLK